jgi:hypothetical protein
MKGCGMFNEKFRPEANYPIYPPYHSGKYIEEYFHSKFDQSLTDRKYLDIFWTNIYCNKDYTGTNDINLQKSLDEIFQTYPYFTVCQHDDGPKEKLPKDTIIFSAGGNRTEGIIVPIPLICSGIPQKYIPEVYPEKKYLASFVGSMTHRIREKLYYYCNSKEGFEILMCNWSNTVPEQNLITFINMSLQSKYTLCPRGYGPTSFRLYESFQLNSVPVYISDRHYLPWLDELNWNEFCVIIKESEIEKMDEILKSIDDDTYNKMLHRGKEVYKDYFTLEGMTNNIIKRLV